VWLVWCGDGMRWGWFDVVYGVTLGWFGVDMG
jgi:hypothetical protein